MGDFLNVVELNTVQLSDTNDVMQSWVHALAPGKYQHPVFGELDITPEKIAGFAESIKNRIRGIDPSINYMHGDAHGGDGEAAGWVKDAKVEPNGLWVLVEWTKEAAEKIKNKVWRYFSAEYRDQWTDPNGRKFANVFFGGALTNRPFMKNLLPINLSESSINFAFELVDTINKAKEEHNKSRKEGDVDLTKLCEVLGLPADSSEAVVLAELGKLKGGVQTPAVMDTKPQDKKAHPTVPPVNISDELRTLAEENAMVRALIETVDAQNKALQEFNIGLREAEINRRLNEFDNTNIVLTPRCKDLVHDFLMEAPVELHERFWEIMGLLKSSSGIMVELGERAGASVRYGKSKDHVTLFMDEANKLAQDKKISLTEAMEQVARDNPELYAGYRNAAYGVRE